MDKYAVAAVIEGEDEIVGHLMKRPTGNYAKLVFYFLRASEVNQCSAVVTGMPVNLGKGQGMQVPCKLIFIGEAKCIDVLRKLIE